MKFPLVIACAVAVAACSSEAPPKVDSALPDPGPKTPDAPTVTATGFGALQAGMTLAAANVALGDSVQMKPGDHEACQMVRFSKLPAGVSAMVLKDTILRIDVDSAGVKTTEGIGIGASEAQVEAAYPGRVAVQAHKYTGPTGHYLVISSPSDSTRRIIFETDGTVVTKYRAGLVPAVDLVEKCS